jgi:protein O-mannosyl-transferase
METPATHASRSVTWLLAALLVLATVFAYQQAWNAGYVWDDDKYVTANPLITEPDGLKRIWFSRDAPSQYFPLVYTTFRIEHTIWGMNPAGYHWVNIILHAANALLVWRLLRVLAIPGAWLAAALFALHPVQVESVAWITERKNVLMGLFFLLALLAWMKFIAVETSARWRYYGLALLLYALSLFSKTTACTMPAALLLILWWRRMPINAVRLAQVTPFVVLGLAMGLLTIWWERNLQGTHGELFAMNLVERALVASRAIWFYISKLAWPAELMFSYPRWDISAADPNDYLWVALTLAAAVAIFFARRVVGRSLETAAVYYVAMLSPMLGFIMLYTFRYTFVADHYQYLATIGPFALVAALVASAADRFAATKATLVNTALSAAMLVPLGLKTWHQCAIYKDEQTLWRATLAVNPSSWMAHNNLGQLDRPEEAIAHYSRALELNPRFAEAHNNLAATFMLAGRVDEALQHWATAIEIEPRYPDARYNFGSALLQLGRLEEATSQLQIATQLNPRNPDAFYNLATALQQLGRREQAITSYERSLRLKLDDAEVLNNLAWLLATSADARLRNASRALELAQRADELTGGANPQIKTTLAAAYAESGRFSEAVDVAQRALALATREQSSLAGAIRTHMRMYEAGSAYRE